MKVIDLLNKIANGEEVPKKIKYNGTIYEKFDYNNKYYDVENNTREKDILSEHLASESFYNDEVEIIEEPQEHKIPEKFKVHSWGDKDKYGSYVDSPFPTNEELMNKINEILDYLEEIE